jgi:hypothetical protein
MQADDPPIAHPRKKLRRATRAAYARADTKNRKPVFRALGMAAFPVHARIDGLRRAGPGRQRPLGWDA